MLGASTDRSRYISYPTNRVVGTVANAERAEAAVQALIEAGFRRRTIDILQGEQDLRRLDAAGAEHGLLAHFQRTLIRVLDLEQFKHLTDHVEDLRAGRFVIMVLAVTRGQRIVAAEILHRHGAESVGFCGRWAWEEVPAPAQASPEQVPHLFARAWNNRDPAALASLFDEDAEFVDATGLRWHNRESIRTGYASRLTGVPDTSKLATGDTKVKRLSPDVAVVQAQMTYSGDGGAGAAPSQEPRTTIASFVVHRDGDRWLCASAHHTDLVAHAETNAIG